MHIAQMERITLYSFFSKTFNYGW